MIWISLFLIIIAHILWAWHDLYFWGKEWIRKWVLYMGWHNIKMVLKIAFFASAFLAGRISAEQSWGTNVRFILALVLASWGAFEGMYNILEGDAKPFDWARHIKIALRWPHMRSEYLLHNACRLHWIEALIVLMISVGLLLIF